MPNEDGGRTTDEMTVVLFASMAHVDNIIVIVALFLVYWACSHSCRSRFCSTHWQVIMPGDPRLSQDKDSSESSSSGEETMLDVEQGSNCVTGASPTCSCLICLEEWREGELICRSAGCPHIFHQTCIVSWLVHHRDCPACRQAFLPAAKDADEEDETEEHEA